jgi:2-oxoglutarate ferredoxin oxidoreductase subunit delta
MSEVSIKEINIQTESGSSTNPVGEARGQVVIFGLWCKGCGLCVEFCPTGVLALGEDDRPVVVKPEKCTACHWCDTHCPDLAIVVKRTKKEED